jgi:L-cysteine S-thiosulfotransferase
MQVCPSAIRLLFAISLLNEWDALPLHAAESTEPSGQQLAFSTAKGNCLACHMMPGDPAAVTSANIGPPLLSMKQRYPDRERLRAQIWDATQFNANTVMPPFGRHKVLSDSEIDKITDYIYGL